MATCTIKITNNSDLPTPQRYVLFFGDVKGKVKDHNSGYELQSIVFYRTDALGKGHSASVKIAPQIFGFVGKNSDRPGKDMQSGDTIELSTSEQVEVGSPQRNNGTELSVSSQSGVFEITALTQKTSKQGTFTIYIQNDGITVDNERVIGVARNVGNAIVPVAAMPVVPGDMNVITPVFILYVGQIESDDNMVVSEDKVALKGKITIAPDQKTVNVSHTTEGAAKVFKVTR